MQGSQGLSETEANMTAPVWVRTRSSAYVWQLLAWSFCGTPNSGRGGGLWLFACSWDPFLPIGLLPSPLIWGYVPRLIYLVRHVQLIFLGVLLFSEWKRRGGSGEEGVWGIERREWRGSWRQDGSKEKQKNNSQKYDYHPKLKFHYM